MAISGGGSKKKAISTSELKVIQALEVTNPPKLNFHSVLLFQDQSNFLAIVGASWYGLESSGMSIMKVVPRRAELSTATLPPWLSATLRTYGKPIPQPSLFPSFAVIALWNT